MHSQQCFYFVQMKAHLGHLAHTPVDTPKILLQHSANNIKFNDFVNAIRGAFGLCREKNSIDKSKIETDTTWNIHINNDAPNE